MRPSLRSFAIWVVVVLLLLAVFTFLQGPSQRPAVQLVSFSEFLNEVDRGRIRAVDIQGPEIRVDTVEGRSFTTFAPNDPSLVQRLYAKGIAITAAPSQPQVAGVEALVISWLPFFFLIGAWLLLTWWTRRGGGRMAPLDCGPAPPGTMLDDPWHWRGRAGEARAIAEQFAEPESRQRMLEIAAGYEYLAARAEARRRGSDKST
jgi:hypothetical protein